MPKFFGCAEVPAIYDKIGRCNIIKYDISRSCPCYNGGHLSWTDQRLEALLGTYPGQQLTAESEGQGTFAAALWFIAIFCVQAMLHVPLREKRQLRDHDRYEGGLKPLNSRMFVLTLTLMAQHCLKFKLNLWKLKQKITEYQTPPQCAVRLKKKVE